jgi:hypothetical protein
MRRHQGAVNSGRCRCGYRQVAPLQLVHLVQSWTLWHCMPNWRCWTSVRSARVASAARAGSRALCVLRSARGHQHSLQQTAAGKRSAAAGTKAAVAAARVSSDKVPAGCTPGNVLKLVGIPMVARSPSVLLTQEQGRSSTSRDSLREDRLGPAATPVKLAT